MQNNPNDRHMNIPLQAGHDKDISSPKQETNDATSQGRNRLRDDANHNKDERKENERNFVSEKQQSTGAKDEIMEVKNEILKREKENEKLKLIRKNRRSRWNDIL